MAAISDIDVKSSFQPGATSVGSSTFQYTEKPRVLRQIRTTMVPSIIGKMLVPLGMVPLILNPIYTLYHVSIYWVYFSFKGLLGGLNR